MAERDEIIDAFDAALTRVKAPFAPRNREQVVELVTTMKRWDRARIRFLSKVRVRSIVASAAFGLPFPSVYPLHAIALPLLPSSDAADDERWKSINDSIERIKSTLPDAYDAFAKTVEKYENYLTECGQLLTTIDKFAAAKVWKHYRALEKRS
jgi:hypothetical protein